ncbi:MAG: hypothetical protein U1F10_00605 [Burkholderiales bacterium]
MAIISLREYDSLHVGAADKARLSVSPSQADALVRLRATVGADVFKFTNRTTLKAQQYVGTVQVGRTTIEVLPKIEGDVTTVRKNLVAMLSVALDLDVKAGDATPMATQTLSILEALIRIFCSKLIYQTHRGLVRRYERREENLAVLRGRLGVLEQVRKNAAHPERMYCRYEEFHEDNALNQILKAAVRLLLRVSRDVTNQRELGELLLIFQEVSDCSTQTLAWKTVTLDRLSWRYRQVFTLARLFLNGTPPDVTAGSEGAFSLFFDMNILFEEYIGRMAQRVFGKTGWRITRQGPQRHAALMEATGMPVFAMRPDVLARGASDSKFAWILDTKWKLLSPEEVKDGVAQGDMYQMLTYGACYRCDDIVLLYPHHGEMGHAPGVRNVFVANLPESLDHQTSQRRVRIASIELSSLQSVPKQLLALFPAPAASLISCAEERCAVTSALAPHAKASSVMAPC